MSIRLRHRAHVRGALVLAIALSILAPAFAAADGPVQMGVASPPAWAAPPRADGDAAISAQAAANRKVVYVVGVVDSVDGSLTKSYVKEAGNNATELRALGMTVVTFFPPNNSWSDIVAAAADADVLVYAGHGMAWDSVPTVGGMSLSATSKVSPDQIRSDLRMAPNAIAIMSHVCFASGGSTTDSGPITSAEAQRRVAQYSDPFLDAGLVAYYSDWFSSFPVDLLTSLANGLTLGAAYEAYSDYTAASVERYAHPTHTDYAMWLDKDDWNGIIYTYSFVGDEGLIPFLSGDPEAGIGMGIDWLQARSEPGAGNITYSYTVTVGSDIQVAWRAWLDSGASWVTVSPTSGVSGGTLRLTITVPAQVGTYETRLHIHTDDPRVGSPDAVVPITLTVAPPAPYELALPSVLG